MNYCKLLLSGILVGVLATGVLSCTKKAKNEEDHRTAGIFEHGTPTSSPAIEAVIGVAGGTLVSADGGLTLTLEPGTVTENTTFSIQEITNTMPHGTGRSYRLLPEGVTFQKPVTVTYKLNDADLAGAPLETKYLAYQNEKGEWAVIAKTDIDATAKTLSVQTTHFSDYSYFDQFRIETDKIDNKVEPGGHISLGVYNGQEDLLVPLVGEYRMSLEPLKGGLEVSNWRLSGDGKLTPVPPNGALYYAPGTIPTLNPVTVSVDIKNVPVPLDERRTAHTQLTLVAEIMIIGPYIEFKISGSSTMLSGNITAMVEPTLDRLAISAITANGQLVMNIGGHDLNSYKYGKVNTPGKAYMSMITPALGADFKTSYYNCGSSIEQYSTGAITITKWGASGTYTEGVFTAEIYDSRVPCNPPSKHITGSFRALIL